MSDPDLFAWVVTQMQHGQSYYHAMGEGLRTGAGSAVRYPAASLFNWRPPLLYLIASWLPFHVPAPLLLTEIWAGLAIAASSLTARTHRRTSLGLACLAGLLRELALSYVLIRAVFGWRKAPRRWLTVWYVVAVYYLGHWAQVQANQLPSDVLGPSWLAFGGVPFLLSTIWPFLPVGIAWGWLIGLIVAVGVRDIAVADRFAVVAYALAFLLVGRSESTYWGFVMLPLQAVCLWHLAVITTKQLTDDNNVRYCYRHGTNTRHAYATRLD